MKFNVNDHVKVRLTERGRKILREKFGHDYVVADENGWSEWQLWQLIEIFGPHIHIGYGNIPFETEIEIIEKKKL